MIPDIKELNFPSYATLSQATAVLNDMDDCTITTQVKIDGNIKPDFSYDWEIEFMGEKYIHPLRSPQALKDNTSINSQIDLTFQHWVIYELKRNYFVQLAPVKAGTAIPDKYIAPLGLSITDFITAFQDVLDYYYKGAIKIILNPDVEYSQDRAFINISYSYMWDVLKEFYKVYGIKWCIKGDTIYVGYPTPEISHVFAYGYDKGLISIERQVQDANIRNSLLGRGGSTNLPKYYFKNAPEGSLYASDPDAIPELENIYFTELRDKVFRDYVQGWETNPNRDTKNGTLVVEPYDTERGEIDFAYKKGHEDKTFDPVEFVKDDVSIAKYGLLPGGLENNNEIYPSIQNIVLEGIGLVNEIAAVEPVVSDDINQGVNNEAILSNIPDMVKTFRVAPQETREIIAHCSFEVRGGYRGTLSLDFDLSSKKCGITDIPTAKDMPADWDNEYWFTKVIEEPTISILNVSDGNFYNNGVNLPSGSYLLTVSCKVLNVYPLGGGDAATVYGDTQVTLSVNNIKLTQSRFDDASELWKPTFDVWVKNIWQTEKLSSETEQEYVDRVWLPILGNEGQNAMVTFSSGWLASSEGWEFMIVKGGISYDTSKSYNGVPSHWRLTLQKSDAELKATDKYIPNTGMQAVAGDTFFLTNIDMQHVYVLYAEQRIFDWKYNALQGTKDILPTWLTKLDKIRINSIEPGDASLLVDNIKVGALVHLSDKRFIEGEIDRYIQTITYNYSDKIVPDIEIVLSDKITPSESPLRLLQGQVDLLSAQIARPSTLLLNQLKQYFDTIYLRKDGVEDISKSPTSFKTIVKSEDFRSGMIGGMGWGVYRDMNGNAVAEFDQVKARQTFTANDIVRNEVKHQGGNIIYSAASIEVSEVVQGDGYYDCFFDQKQGARANLFALDDVALSTTFDPYNNSINSYKCRVIALGEDYIRLSATEKLGDGIPSVGDTIIHYGNYTDKNRQYVIVRSVVGGGREYMLSGLDRVNTLGKEYYFAGRKDGGNPRWFVGDLEGDYAEWYDGKMYIKGMLEVGSSVGGATVVDGGLVTAETISLGSGGNINAGVTGSKDAQDAVRFWAGTSFEDRFTAPFRVLQNGQGFFKAGEVGDFTIDKALQSNNKYGRMALHTSGLSFAEKSGNHTLEIPININLPNKNGNHDAIHINIPKTDKAINIESGNVVINNGYLKVKNSLFHCVQFKNITEATDDFDYHYLDPNVGTSWMVYNTVGELQAAYLPRLEDMRSLLGISDAETPFGITIEIVNSRNSILSIGVGFENKAHNIYDWNGNQEEGNYRSLQKGDSLRVMLVFDGTEYYAQIINFEN